MLLESRGYQERCQMDKAAPFVILLVLVPLAHALAPLEIVLPEKFHVSLGNGAVYGTASEDLIVHRAIPEGEQMLSTQCQEGGQAWRWPLDFDQNRIVACWHEQRSYSLHSGIDIGAPAGSPIYAVANGDVLYVQRGCVAGNKRCGHGYGNFVLIKHGDYWVRYNHMVRVEQGIEEGGHVTQGQVIGKVGNTGYSFGAHLDMKVYDHEPSEGEYQTNIDPFCMYPQEYIDNTVNAQWVARNTGFASNRVGRCEDSRQRKTCEGITPPVSRSSCSEESLGTVIVLDPGHATEDRGYLGEGLEYTEGGHNFLVAKEVQRVLESRGYTVILTRDDIRKDCLGNTYPVGVAIPESRVKEDFLCRKGKAINNNAAAFVSIHSNAGGGSGPLGIVACQHPGVKEDGDINYASDTQCPPGTLTSQSKDLSHKITDAIAQHFGFSTKQYWGGDPGVLEGLFMPATLVEIFFHDNRNDLAKANGKDRDMGEAIAQGIMDYVGPPRAAGSSSQITQSTEPAKCQYVVDKAEEFLGTGYTRHAGGLVNPAQARSAGTTCATFVQSVFHYAGLQNPTGNGNAICPYTSRNVATGAIINGKNTGLMIPLGTNPDVLQPGDVFAAHSRGSPAYGHTGIYVGKGDIENGEFVPDPGGKHIFIHSVGPVKYGTYEQLFGPGKWWNPVYQFCRHVECQ